MSRIAVVGTGYVGLTTGAYLAHLGHDVVCADVVPEKIERLKKGDVPIVEPGLDELVREGIDENRLTFVLGATAACKDAEFIFLCLPTPQGEDGSADLSYVESAAREIGPIVRHEAVVINKSTVPVGSTRIVEQAMGRDDVYVVSNPEFLREGSAVYDCLNPDRIVIGSDHKDAAIRVSELFSKLNAPLVITDPSSSETIKYASNAFLATKISFINAMANVCESVGADVKEVSLGMGFDKRIGFEFLKPGPGWGGSCFVGEESILVRRNEFIELLSFEELFARVEADGPDGWEALSWRDNEPTPEFFPIESFSARQYDDAVIDVKTKMGRRLTTTVDHPYVVSGGIPGDEPTIKYAYELTTDDWLPVAQNFPLTYGAFVIGDLIDSLPGLGIEPTAVIVRLSKHQLEQVRERADEIHWTRRRDILRCGAMRLSELQDLRIATDGAMLGTTTNGTYVPSVIEGTDEFWHVLGLYLAEGHIGEDGQRHRIAWSFHPTDEQPLVDAVSNFWGSLGVKHDVRRMTTTTQVSVSSRVLSAWLREGLRVGHNCYDKRVPDQVWGASPSAKRALLRGLWDGDGSWSKVNQGPSVVFEYGTVSRALADAMLRLLGDFGIVARLKVGRGAKSTVDTYWLTITGAAQLEDALWLFPEDEQDLITKSISGQQKRIAATGYRRNSKNAAWVRVTETVKRPYSGTVYSLEVCDTHKVVTTNGLVVSNCFPKDSHALVKIAEDAGYDFALLKSVIEVNNQQYDEVAKKIRVAAGGSLEGKTIGVWGLAFKANTDDLRDSPALYVIDRLVAQGATVKGYDITQTRELSPKHPTLDKIEVVADPFAAADGVDVLAVLTEWNEFRWLDFAKVKEVMASPVIVDARNLLDSVQIRRKGFNYTGVGRS